LGVVLLCAPTASDAADTGVVPDLTWGINSTAKQQTAAALQELGAQWVRMSVSWSDDVEPRKGSYQSAALSRFDEAVNIAQAAGYRVILMVEQSPSWAHDGTNDNSPPRDNADLADFMGFLAARYVGKVEAYEVWNEPNLPWAWPSGPDGGEYAQMLKTVAPAIRAADPNAKVVYAGLNRNDYGFVEAGYRAVPNMGGYFDVMALHPYVDGGLAPETVKIDPNGRISPGSFAGYREVRRSMLNHGDTKPIWLTEFGWSTTSLSRGVSPATQADYLVRAYRCLEQDPYVQVATWYNLRNEFWQADADNWFAQLGLMSTDFTRKPAFDALKNYRPGTGTCTYDYPSTSPTVAPPVTKLLPTAPPAGPAVVPPTSHRSVPRLSVQQALIRDGHLVLDAKVARGAIGTVRGAISYEGIRHTFVARPDTAGKIRVREPLADAAGASAGWVALVYDRDAHFQRQWVVLQAAVRGPRLKLGTDGRTTSLGLTRSVAGTVARKAKGAVVLGLTYRTVDGKGRMVTRRSKIRNGEFRSNFRLPAGARDATVYAVFAGDAARGISGGSRVVALG
jgi:hypothetical protein